LFAAIVFFPFVCIYYAALTLIQAFVDEMFFCSKRHMLNIFIPLMMIVYWGIVFAVICVFNAMALEGEFSSAFLLYPVFLMPSFVLEIILVGLIGSGI
jgi:hypothetical protein